MTSHEYELRFFKAPLTVTAVNSMIYNIAINLLSFRAIWAEVLVEGLAVNIIYEHVS